MKALLVLALVALLVGVVLSTVTFSEAGRPDQPPDPGECRPGYGYGDPIHCHTGPPGPP